MARRSALWGRRSTPLRTINYVPPPPPPPQQRTILTGEAQWPMFKPLHSDQLQDVIYVLIIHLNDLHERLQSVEDTIGLALEDDEPIE